MLRRGTASVFDIARNMGTSVQIIESYYGNDPTPIAVATKLCSYTIQAMQFVATAVNRSTTHTTG